jgi:phenylalanyl-tRNA synthetase beta chain
MHISLAWLARHVDLDGIDVDALCNRFTLSVAELEGWHRFEDEARAVVGVLREAVPLPNSKLKRCRVDIGARTLDIVCGAPNVAAEQRVAVVLPGGRILGKDVVVRPVGGVESQGVLVSEHELGIGADEAGILVLSDAAEPGLPVAKLAAFSDVVLEIDNKSLTHRPDLWGHRGIAREVAALLGRPLKPLALDVVLGVAPPCEVEVAAPAACKRYTALGLRGFSVQSSPLWLRVLLSRVGTRPINNVVDATNFVMLDLGNPVHAFDRRRLSGARIVVRQARAGEALRTLDGIERQLEPRDLVIADGERPIALAGIMGGEHSGIEADTTDMVLEAANFDPAVVRVTAQRLGLRTEASARFEKSLDPELAAPTALSFAKLLRELCPSTEVYSSLLSVGAPREPEKRVTLRLDRLRRRLGVELPRAQVVGYLAALEFDVRSPDDETLDVGVPSFRATKDINQEVDLIEEIGRCYGYNNIPPAPPAVVLQAPDPNHRRRFERALQSYLTQAAGLDEMLGYSFSSDSFLSKIGARREPRCTLKNPISDDLRTLRTELATGLLENLNRNAKNFDTIGIFEIGRVFEPPAAPGELPRQPVALGILLAEAGTDADPEATLFFRLKGIAEGLARAVQRPAFTFENAPLALGFTHPARRAHIQCAGERLGYLAEVHPTVLGKLDRPFRAAVLELDLDRLRVFAREETAPHAPPEFPATFRDFAFVLSDATPASSLSAAIAAASALVKGVRFASIYRGRGVPEGHKCLAWSVTFREPNRTLTDAEVQAASDSIVQRVQAELGGRLR